jgi:hypothetical protein
MPRHRSEEIIRFLRLIDRETPSDVDPDLIVDNSSSWLNMAKRWFREINQKRIRRGSFESVKQLIGAIEEYLDQHNRAPKRFVWTKNVDMILSKVARCKEALLAAH